MRLGIFGARADQRGLAYQTQAYAKWLVPERVYGLDLTADEMSPYECDWRPFWDCPELTTHRFSEVKEESVRRWLKGLDVVLGAETFYFRDFPIWAKAEGVKTVLQINPEFTGWWGRAKEEPKPDVLVNPTTWRTKHLPGVIHLPFPVDRELFPYRPRAQAEKFVHIAGHVAMADRAGTKFVIGQAAHFKTKVTIRSQSGFSWEAPHSKNVGFEVKNVADPRQLYEDADVIVLPRRYGGNNLVANEALSCGCPLITLNRIPENTWGGVYPIPTRPRGTIRTKAGLINLDEAQPNALARAINFLLHHPTEVARLSEEANVYAQTISWDSLLPRYMDILACD